MGAIIGIIGIVLLIVYPPYMMIKWAIYGRGVFLPNFRRMSEKLQSISDFHPKGKWLKFNYYFLFLWTIGEFALFIYLIFKFH